MIFTFLAIFCLKICRILIKIIIIVFYSVTDMELLRKQLNCESSMVVVGCGDKNLRISRYHRSRLLVTQSYVDK